MHRHALLEALHLYSERWVAGSPLYAHYDFVEEQAQCLGIRQFVEETRDCFQRSHASGHITASALVTNPSCDRVLLTLHAKLGKWLQLGGHCDGDWDVPGSALREAREESGREEVALFPLASLWTSSPPGIEIPLDCDIHAIPARGNEAAHFHYDVRYLCVLDPALPLHISQESKDLRWLPLEEAYRLTNERSMRRQFDKLKTIAARMSTEDFSRFTAP